MDRKARWPSKFENSFIIILRDILTTLAGGSAPIWALEPLVNHMEGGGAESPLISEKESENNDLRYSQIFASDILKICLEWFDKLTKATLEFDWFEPDIF